MKQRKTCTKSREASATREAMVSHRGVVEDLTETICRFRPDSTLTYVNEVFCRFFGKPREELVGKPWLPVAVPEDAGFVVQDGEPFYIAQTDFRPAQWTHYAISPTKVKWAKWNPKGPWDFEWDRKTATFEEHKFTDVRAAGFEWTLDPPRGTNKKGWDGVCRGGSFRSNTNDETTPALNNKFVTRYSVGGLSTGLAVDEIGFRVVRNAK